MRCVFFFLPFSWVGWWLQWNGVCLSATTTPEVTTGRTAFPPAPISYRPSWQTVKKEDPLNECGVIWISGYPKRLFCLLLYQGFKPLLARGWWVVSTASLCGSTYISGVCWPTGCTCLSGSRVWGPFCWLQGACWLCLLRWKYQVTEIQFLQVNAIWLNT